MKDLAGLKAVMADERVRSHARRCVVCRKGREVTDAIERFAKAREKSPDEWAGVTIATLLRWAEARKCGIDGHSLMRHYRATRPGFWEGLVGG